LDVLIRTSVGNLEILLAQRFNMVWCPLVTGKFSAIAVIADPIVQFIQRHIGDPPLNSEPSNETEKAVRPDGRTARSGTKAV